MRTVLLVVGMALAAAVAAAAVVREDGVTPAPVGVLEAPAASATLVDQFATPEPGETPLPDAPGTPPELPTEPDPAPDGGWLAVGITEPNPNLVWPAGSSDVPADFAPWRDAVGAMRPHFYRLQLDWAQLQPDEDEPPDFDRRLPGCMRDRLPCAPWQGLREQLSALAGRQREGGWETVVTIAGTPEWAAGPAEGCERGGTTSRSRTPRRSALPAYRRFVEQVLALAGETGAELTWWNAWNEPNHPYFLSPQRLECDPEAPAESVKAYMHIHAALGEALDVAPGEQRRVLGDLAGIDGSREDVVSVSDFIADLPREVVCETPVWAQHAYLTARNDARVAKRALAEHACPEPHEIWVTETGVRNGETDPEPRRRCRSMNQRMRVWRADPQVTVAFQYTVREDDRFPYGLVTTGLERAYPVLNAWQAWGGAARPSPGDPPPDSDVICADPAAP